MTAPKCIGCPFRRDCPGCPWTGETPAAAAIRCRPAGAPTWDHAGTVAQIAARRLSQGVLPLGGEAS